MNIVGDITALTGSATRVDLTFPAVPYASAGSYFQAYAMSSAQAGSSIDLSALDKAAGILVEAYELGARVFACGNGGSAAIANHLACDHLKGVRTHTDLVPRVVSLSSNVELITAIANDLAYEDVFTYQLESQSSAGDVLIAISSSGASPNILKALGWAREHDVRTIALTGFGGGDAIRIADVTIHAEETNYGIVEDLHQAIMHALAQYIRQSRMSPDEIASTVF